MIIDYRYYEDKQAELIRKINIIARNLDESQPDIYEEDVKILQELAWELDKVVKKLPASLDQNEKI